MAKCDFPLALSRSFYRTAKKACDAKGKYNIVFQGIPMVVCKGHRQYDGRQSIGG